MKIMPITTNENNSAKNLSFKAGRFGYMLKDVPKSVMTSFNQINLSRWDRKIVCDTFENAIEELKNSATANKDNTGFKNLYKMYKTNGLRGMLYALGQPNSEALKKIMGTNQRYEDKYLLTTNSGNSISIKNNGPWGFFKTLFNIKGQNEIIIDFRDKKCNGLKFSLDKNGDYQVEYSQGYPLYEKWSYYANKDKVKKKLLPKGDLYLPPGV